MKRVLSVLLVVALLISALSALAGEYTDKTIVKAVQKALNDEGYNCGTPDGIAGKKTKQAINAYQKDNGLPITGVVDEDLLRALGLLSQSASISAPSPTPSLPSKEIITNGYSYSTNSKSTIKKGKTGMYAYRHDGLYYDVYYIIDFDEGYVYSFCEGEGNILCDRVKITSGDLNSVLIITYHEDNDVWSFGLHFRWKNQPEHLIVQDNDGFECDYYSTDLVKAYELLKGKTILNY